MKKKLKRNITLLALNLMFGKNITTPIIILYYLLNGLNFAQIGILTAVAQFTDAILEVYGGALSDIFGKKRPLILYSALRIMWLLILLFSHSFAGFAVASLFYGIALGIGQGTQHAMLFDTLKALKREGEHKKFRGRLQFITKTFNALSILAIPVLYTLNVKLPFLIGFIFYLIAFIIALFFQEPIPIKKTKKNLATLNKKVINGFKEVIFSKKILFIAILQAILLGFILVSFDYFQPLLKITGLSIALFGLVYTLARFIEGLGGEIVHRLEKVFSNKKLLITGILFIILSFISFFIGKNWLIIFAILLISFSDGFIDVVLGDMLNINISSENRTTIMSIATFLQGIFTAILAYFVGLLADKVGVISIFAYILGVFIFLIIILALVFRQKISVHQK
ncbi:MAG: MFS transporter [Candidatus Berkelbacteria bacterium]|nr:MFS transporter [Candidatus Berkelbacteria bacterium]